MTDNGDDDLEAALVRVGAEIAGRLGETCDVCRVFSWNGERFVPVDVWLTTGTR